MIIEKTMLKFTKYSKLFSYINMTQPITHTFFPFDYFFVFINLFPMT